MKEIKYIKKDLEKLVLLSDLYYDLCQKETSSDNDLEMQKLKAYIAKEEMLKINYKIHKLIKRLQARL
ncbi:hypothetical protein JW930_05585 [Candidatus Woesearchaeota archaeon]|nr:hypothetical protein [Candidatus Woesearchaeota archaeon]